MFGLSLLVAGCRHDGRTLREPGPDQTASISVPPPETTILGLDPDLTSIDPADTIAGSGSTTTLPPPTVLGITAPWRDGAPIDARYTCDGLNVAPALSWDIAPVGTVEIAITMTDLDAPDFAHWVMAGLEPQLVTINEATVPIGAYQATNGVGAIGYTGPCPPAGSAHAYVITVHYLGAKTDLDDGSPSVQLTAEITAAEIASAEVDGTFSRG